MIGNLNPYEEPTSIPPAESTQTPAPETTLATPDDVDPAKHDETDVQMALEKDTQDGKGSDPIPEPDFVSFATTGVQTEELNEVARRVLAGKLGAGEERRMRLQELGYDPTEIAKIVNRRLASGASTAFPTTVREDATAVIRGEWGSDEDEIKRNLISAGKNPQLVEDETKRQLGM